MPAELPVLLSPGSEMKAPASCPELSSPRNRLFLPKRCRSTEPKRTQDLPKKQRNERPLSTQLFRTPAKLFLVSLSACWHSRRHRAGLPGAVRVSCPQRHRELGEVKSDITTHKKTLISSRTRWAVTFVSVFRSWSRRAPTSSQLSRRAFVWMVS